VFFNRYELSQDLLDKQIELLERKYGGVIARNAALTIQRAFRHYTMVKKFAAITAMAKAEKRLSRRVSFFVCMCDMILFTKSFPFILADIGPTATKRSGHERPIAGGWPPHVRRVWQ
jgi:hypothetical protein